MTFWAVVTYVTPSKLVSPKAPATSSFLAKGARQQLDTHVMKEACSPADVVPVVNDIVVVRRWLFLRDAVHSCQHHPMWGGVEGTYARKSAPLSAEGPFWM